MRSCINGILYSVLGRRPVKQAAAAINLLTTLERAADRANATFVRHLMHICKQLQRPADAGAEVRGG